MAEAPSVQDALDHCEKYELASGKHANTEIYKQILKTHIDLQVASFDSRQLSGSNGIFFLGDTGVGKSTLANAMMHGHENMVWVKKVKPLSEKDIEKAKKTGKDPKPKTEKVLELADGYKQAFAVSGKALSCTELPVVAEVSPGCILIDCPGSSDSNEWREYTN